jgi:shikimate kinase
MSGIGKSFWSERLVHERGFVRHDCDGAIARALVQLVTPRDGEAPAHALGRWMGMPWSAGYAERERRYLALERDVTVAAIEAVAAAAPGAPAQVIDSTGSIIYLDDEVLSRLREIARVVYLRAPEAWSAQLLARYLEEPTPVVWDGVFEARPSESHEEALARCYRSLLSTRDRRYREIAHAVVDADALAPGTGCEVLLGPLG